MIAATNPRPCQVDGKTYRDGEQFSPNCSLLCTCQDGKYACSSKCPQELRPPSSVHCKDSHLVSIRDRCCKEWVCPHSHSMVGPDDNSQFREYTRTILISCNNRFVARKSGLTLEIPWVILSHRFFAFLHPGRGLNLWCFDSRTTVGVNIARFVGGVGG